MAFGAEWSGGCRPVPRAPIVVCPCLFLQQSADVGRSAVTSASRRVRALPEEFVDGVAGYDETSSESQGGELVSGDELVGVSSGYAE